MSLLFTMKTTQTRAHRSWDTTLDKHRQRRKNVENPTPTRMSSNWRWSSSVKRIRITKPGGSTGSIEKRYADGGSPSRQFVARWAATLGSIKCNWPNVGRSCGKKFAQKIQYTKNLIKIYVEELEKKFTPTDQLRMILWPQKFFKDLHKSFLAQKLSL